MNDTDSIADAGRDDPDFALAELVEDAADGDPALAEGVVAGLVAPEAALGRAESSLLQPATARSAAPNAPLRAVRRDTTAKREKSFCVMVYV